MYSHEMIDSAEESIFISGRFSDHLSTLEAQRLMAQRRHFLVGPVIDLLTQLSNRPRTVMNRAIKPGPSMLED